MPQFIKLETESLHEKVASYIVDLIVSKELAPGDTLPSEREIAERFGVSRTVIRDAIRLLVAKGMVVVRQGRNASVTPNAREALLELLALAIRRGDYSKEELVQTRRFIETQAALLAAQRQAAKDVESLAEALERLRQRLVAKDWAAAEQAHADFHLALVESSGNRLLIDFIGPVLRASLAYLRPVLTDDGAWEDYGTHEDLLKSIRAGDAAATLRSINQHMWRLEAEQAVEHEVTLPAAASDRG